MIKLAGIYKIKFEPSIKVYVGSSKHIKRRWSDHLRKLRRNKSGSPLLQRAFNKYGEDVISFEIIELTDPSEKTLITRETHWYYEYKKTGVYNILSPDDTGFRTATQTGKDNHNYGKIFSDELRLKLSIAHGAKPFRVFKDDELVGEWINVSQCRRELKIPYSGEPFRCLKGRRKSCMGYTFKYI